MKLATLLMLGAPLYAQTLINAGGPTTGSFSADFGFSGGATWGPANQADMAVQAGIYPSLRYSTSNSGFSYDIIEPVGVCDVTLDLLEPNKTGPGQRVFTVTANGNSSGPLDVFRLAGAALIPRQFVIPGVWVLDGHLRIVFTPITGKGNAIVSGLEVNCHLPAVPTGPQGLTGQNGPPGTNGITQIVPFGSASLLLSMINCKPAAQMPAGQAGLKCSIDPANPTRLTIALDPPVATPAQ